MSVSQDGDRHDRLIYLTAPIAPAICGGLAWWGNAEPQAIVAIGISAITAHLFGGLYLSPDLDLAGTIRCKSWWRWEHSAKLGWVWMHYPRLVGCHRSRWSHAPLLGSATRLLYLMAILPFLLPVFVRRWRRLIAVIALVSVALSYTPWWSLLAALVVGIETSAIAHYTQDGTVLGGWHRPRRSKPRRKP
jgi:uncharacterized metal-binding protein